MNNNVLQKISDKYGDKCRCTECGTGCSIKLHGLNCVVLKGEELVQNSKKICDCFIFDDRDKLTIHLAELKSKYYKADDIKEKFENSLSCCRHILKNINANKQYIIELVLVACAHRHIEYRILKKRPIRFNNRSYHLHFKKCGLVLSDLYGTK